MQLTHLLLSTLLAAQACWGLPQLLHTGLDQGVATIRPETQTLKDFGATAGAAFGQALSPLNAIPARQWPRQKPSRLMSVNPIYPIIAQSPATTPSSRLSDLSVVELEKIWRNLLGESKKHQKEAEVKKCFMSKASWTTFLD